jgi:hypothetical protein
MSADKEVEFPKFATEESYVYGFTLTEAVLVLGGMGAIVITRQILLSAAITFLLWRVYIWYRDKGQSNIAMQLAYKAGFIVPKSHIFPEPNVDAFRE